MHSSPNSNRMKPGVHSLSLTHISQFLFSFYITPETPLYLKNSVSFYDLSLLKKKTLLEGWRDGSTGNNTGCSSKD